MSSEDLEEFYATGLLKTLFSAVLLQIYVKQDWKSLFQFSSLEYTHFTHAGGAGILNTLLTFTLTFCRHRSVVTELISTY